MFDFYFVFFETGNVFLINFLVYCFDFINFENFFNLSLSPFVVRVELESCN